MSIPGFATNRVAPSAGTRSLWRLAWRRFLTNRAAVAGALVFALLVLAAACANLIAPHDPVAQNIPKQFQEGFWKYGLSTSYLLGSDALGRDVLSRLLFGARVTVLVASLAVLMALLAGITTGLAAGFYGRMVDNILMRLMDVLLAFPTLILAIAIIAILGPGISNAILAIGIVYTPAIARVVRSSVLAVKEEDYVLAARAVGSRSLRIILRHVLPNVIGPTAVYGTLGIASAILDTSFLGFLGLGVQPPTAEWGTMLSDSRDYIALGYWWIAVFPGLIISITVLAVNLMGNGLRDAVDPRSGQRV